MSYGCRKIPVPVLVLVFLLLFGGCGRDEIVELAPVNGEAETSEPAPVNGEAEAAVGAQTAGNLRTDAEPSGTAQTAAPAAQADSAAASGSIAAGGQSGAEESETEPAVWMVHICGAVNRPGVYTFPEGSRVCDAVEAAGGLSEDAAESLLNQAALLSDGLQIMVPTLEEAEGLSRQTASSGIFSSDISGAGSAAGGEEAGNGLVNINTATLEELMTLPGIGQTRAEAIVAYRDEQGGFQSIEDIMNVSGIKEGSFAKLKDRITV